MKAAASVHDHDSIADLSLLTLRYCGASRLHAKSARFPVWTNGDFWGAFAGGRTSECKAEAARPSRRTNGSYAQIGGRNLPVCRRPKFGHSSVCFLR